MRFSEIISEAGSNAQRAAAMKKAGKKPKSVAEGSNKQLKEARKIAGVMTDPQAKTIKDPATSGFIPADDFFAKYPDENKQAWETAIADLFDPAKAKAAAAASSAEYNKQFNDVSWMTPEEQAQYKQLQTKDQAATQATNTRTYGAERYLKKLFQQKMDAKKAASMLKVHWAPLNQLESFLQGKVNNKIELSAYLAPNTESLGKTRWGGGSSPTVGIVLDGHITIGGRGDLASDQYKMTAGQREQQKYSSRPGQIDPTLSMDTSVHHEVLVDNWKIKEIVLPADIPPEVDRLVQQYKIPVRRLGNPQGVAEGEGGLGQVAGIGINGKQFNFSIKDLIAKAQNYPVKKLNPQLFVKQLADRHEDPKQTAARAQSADLQYPIIVVQDGNTLMIADGTHRAQKAIMNKLPAINAHVIPVKDMAEFSKQGVAEGENWSKHNNKRAGGMSKKSVSVYRREHPGSKIQTAVTTKPSKLKKGSKSAKRRASFCARMRGMKKHRTGAKTAHDPNSNINKSLRRWHCESIEELHELVMLAEQYIRDNKK
jgi:hypothetical protein